MRRKKGSAQKPTLKRLGTLNDDKYETFIFDGKQMINCPMLYLAFSMDFTVEPIALFCSDDLDDYKISDTESFIVNVVADDGSISQALGHLKSENKYYYLVHNAKDGKRIYVNCHIILSH